MARQAWSKQRKSLSVMPAKWHPPKSEPRRWHWHGCAECGAFYTDTLDCWTDGENGLCATCLNGRPRPIWDRNGDPRECCLANSQLVTEKEEIFRYRLGGSEPWWQCTVCKRAQIYRPMTLRPDTFID